METGKATKFITLRVTEEMHERLSVEADSQNRPLANYVKAILFEHLDSIDRYKKIVENKKKA